MITKFATVTLWVDDFNNAIKFYRDVLGLELLTKPGDMLHFKVGDSILVLAKGKFTQPSDAFPPEFPQLALAVDDLDRMAAHLQNLQVELETNIQERRDSCWIKLRDPDGNLIELVEVKP
ncbi:MAG: VOC family protein [Pelolinea sp.]|nr:VOC family protein [Pelolinea sp.]